MENLVSIVLPVYNVENYIEKCLKSIQKQTYTNLEIIIVNDGTTDGSMAFCEIVSEQDSRFTIINKNNGGLSDARNVGLEATRGKYIIFIDSDDFVAPNLVEHLVFCLENTNSDIAICDPIHFYSDKAHVNQNAFSMQTQLKTFTPEEALCEMFYQKSFLVSAWAKIYKRELFDGIRFPVGKLFEDSAIMYLLFENCKTISYSDAKLYAYVHRKESITTNKFSDRDLDILEISDTILLHFKNNVLVYRAAISYKVSACFRVLLNSSSVEKYINIQNECRNYILRNWKNIIFDNNVRMKNKLALVSITLFNPFVKFIYSRVNRWE